MTSRILVWIISCLLWGAICAGSLVSEAQTPAEDETEDWDFANEPYPTPRDVERFVIDVEALQLTTPLIDREEARQAFEPLSDEFFSSMRAIDREDREKYAYDTDFLANVTQFIPSYRNDTTALTAKFYLARYLASTYKTTVTGRALGTEIWEEAMALFASIQSAFPETWQAKASKIYVFYATKETPETEQEAALQIAECKALLPIARDLDNDPEYIQFSKHFRREERSLAADLRGDIIALELWWGHLDRAEEELAILEQEYPGLPVTRGARGSIDDVYAFQFHGDLGMKDKRLFRLLTTSEDAKIVKQAAAALGNVVIWVGLKAVEESIQERIHELVLGYIDRAMTGDADEREEMVELMYRLWQLSVPALLETLDHDDPEWVAFAGERLLYMKNEEIITAIIDKARATEDEDKKAQLIEILSRMNEPCEPVMRFRECLDDVQAEELYQRLVVPALEELQAEAPTPTP